MSIDHTASKNANDDNDKLFRFYGSQHISLKKLVFIAANVSLFKILMGDIKISQENVDI